MTWIWGIALLSYASATTFGWLYERKKRYEISADFALADKALKQLRIDFQQYQNTCAERLKAKQDAIEKFKQAIVEDADVSRIGLLIESELQKDD